MAYARVLFRVHALERMHQRQISEKAVIRVLDTGQTIGKYPDDKPYPSRLVFGWWESRPNHVVVADDTVDEARIVVTVYEPNLDEWEPGFTEKKKQ